MSLAHLRNRTVAFLGLGIENYALLEVLFHKKVTAAYTVCDSRTPKALGDRYHSLNAAAERAGMKLTWRTGAAYDRGLERYDVVIRIAGYPLYTPALDKARAAGTEVTSPTRLFFDTCPSKNIIGVTGTNGKGTTSSLIKHMFDAAKVRCHIGGNIGIPMFSFLHAIKKDDWVILELSSFQLEDLHVSPHIAVLTNFTRDHLAPADPNNSNHHTSLRDYWRAKTNIFRYQKKGDVLIAPHHLLARVKKIPHLSKNITYTTSTLKSQLIGEHNQHNVAAAAAAAKAAGISSAAIRRGIQTFPGLEHRLEFVAEHKGVKYYNDTFSTTPEALMTALKSFPATPIVLIAGGASKQSSYAAVAQRIRRSVQHVIMLPGEGSRELRRELTKTRYRAIVDVQSMSQAVREAAQRTPAGGVILLSPACASFGIFKNYKERGEQFKEAVRAL